MFLMRLRREISPGTHAPPSAYGLLFRPVFDRRKAEFYHDSSENCPEKSGVVCALKRCFDLRKNLDRDVSEIGKQLPRKSRGDIQTEIRSTLEDMLEERAAGAGRPADDEMVKELLKEYGTPDKVAQSYLPTQYLIGPRCSQFSGW